ncbi:MAG: choice-of-anchor Q domain-containing protein, partial [Synechococcus sp.]
MATFTVTNTWNGGAGSLRKAIVDSNKTAGADKIEFDSSLSGKKINLKSQLVISDGLTIDGDIDNDGTPDITVDAKQISRVFNVDDGKGRVEKKVTLEGLTITGGQLANYKDIENSILDNDGAGILNKENLTVTNSVITGNNTLLIFPGENNNPDYILAYGGGIRNSGTLTISNSILHNNRATLGGGISNSGVATINSSIISGNEAERGGGGGINNDGEGNLNISSSLIYDNSAYTYGAGIFNSGNITVSNSTLTANFSHNYSNGFALFNRGNARVLNSTIAGSSSSGGSFGYSSSEDADLILRSSIVEYLDGDGITAGNSLIENAEDASIDVDLGGNILGQVAGLDPVGLQDNGGPTPTIALLPNSPAINAGDNPLGLINDQRGTGFSRVVGGKPDIGAFEVQSGGPSPSDNPLLFSLKKNHTINGLAVKTDDIVQFDGEKFSTFFDGSDVGLGGKKPAINAFDVIDDKKVLLSFERNFWLKGFGNVNRSDVLLFEATSLGHRTRGRFSKYFDGS